MKSAICGLVFLAACTPPSGPQFEDFEFNLVRVAFSEGSR